MTSKQSLLHCLIYSQVYMVLLEPISYRFMSPVCLSTKERVFSPLFLSFLPQGDKTLNISASHLMQGHIYKLSSTMLHCWEKTKIAKPDHKRC